MGASNFKKDRGQPRLGYQPSGKEIRTKETPSSADQETPAWQFHRCDADHEWWGWNKLTAEDQIKIIKSLCSIERITWAKLKEQAGGRRQGTNHHSLSVNEFAKDAKKRLQELKLDDIDELFSLRLANKTRLYGIRNGRALQFIWYDPHHGDKNGAYPTSRN